MEDPRILILDEPFNGLNKEGMEDMHALFQELKAQGKTILLVRHKAHDISKACGVVYEISHSVLSPDDTQMGKAFGPAEGTSLPKAAQA